MDSKTKLVIFDLDNTLVITKPAAKEGYKQAIYYLARQSGLDKQKDKLYNHWKRIVQTLLGEHKPHKRRFAYSLDVLMKEHNLPETYYQKSLSLYEKVMLENLEIQKGAKELLSTLKDNQIPIAVTTGSDLPEARKKLKAVDLYSYVDRIVIAGEIESMKPNPQYYQILLDEFQVAPTETVVIGDNQAEDIAPAVKLGIKAYRVTPQTHLMEFIDKIS